MDTTFGYSIRWGRQTFTVNGEPTHDEAKRKCIEWASKNGWPRPKWWQFWRWDDTRP